MVSTVKYVRDCRMNMNMSLLPLERARFSLHEHRHPLHFVNYYKYSSSNEASTMRLPLIGVSS